MKTQNGEKGKGFFSRKLVISIENGQGIPLSDWEIPLWIPGLLPLLFALGLFFPFAPKLLAIPIGIVFVVLGVYSFYFLLYVLPDLAEKDRIKLEDLKQKREEGKTS